MRRKLYHFALLMASLLVVVPTAAQAPWAGVLLTPYPAYGETPVLLAAGPTAFWELYNGYPMMQYGYYSDVVHSNNGGQTITRVMLGRQNGYSSSSPGTGTSVLDLSALDGQVAWALRADVTNYVFSGTASLLYTTTGPTGFAVHSTPLPANAQQLHFFTASQGVVIARPATGATTWPIYRTIDGGTTWQLVATAPALTTGDSRIISKTYVGNSLWFTTSKHDLLRTSDQGASWASTLGVGRVAFESEQSGLAYDSTATGQHLLSTTNGGQTWSTVAFSGQEICSTTELTAIPGIPGTYLSVGYRLGSNYPYYDGKTGISHDRGVTWTTWPNATLQFTHVVAGSSTSIWASINEHGYSAISYSVLRFTGSVLLTRSPVSNELGCYPNPTSGLLQVTGSLPAGGLEARLYNALGQLCQASQLTPAAPTIDLSALASGLYELTLRTAAGQVYSQRVQKSE